MQLYLDEINKLHPNLKFTLEREKNGELPVLDMKILHKHSTWNLEWTWYSKPTDTGLIMNYHALAPRRYKRSVVTGFVHRFYRACSIWPLFHQSLKKAKRILEQNQYPPAFFDPLIRQTIHNILGKKEQPQEKQTPETTKKNITFMYHYSRIIHSISGVLEICERSEQNFWECMKSLLIIV